MASKHTPSPRVRLACAALDYAHTHYSFTTGELAEYADVPESKRRTLRRALNDLEHCGYLRRPSKVSRTWQRGEKLDEPVESEFWRGFVGVDVAPD